MVEQVDDDAHGDTSEIECALGNLNGIFALLIEIANETSGLLDVGAALLLRLLYSHAIRRPTFRISRRRIQQSWKMTPFRGPESQSEQHHC